MPFVAAFLIGFVCGLRSMTGPAAVAWAVHRGSLTSRAALYSRMGSTIGVVVLTVCAVGEFVADKLPWTPSRLRAPSLVVRAAMGAICGGAFVPRTASMWIGGVIGACGAIAGSFAGYHARQRVVRRLGAPDWTVALAEDAIAIAAAFFIVSTAS